jgi:hypothetical protein
VPVGRRSGDSCGRRRARWGATATLVVALLAGGCAGDGDDGDAAPPADLGSSTMSTTGSTDAPDPGDAGDPSDPPVTAPETTLPEGSASVPVDPELAELLPPLPFAEQAISTDVAFDERLCTGEKAPAIPKSQARATYTVSETEQVTIAAYRFSGEGGPLYLADYAESIRACAEAVGEVVGLGLPDAIGSSFYLRTTRGEAFIALALRDDVIWILFQERTDGPVEVAASTLDLYRRVLGG